MPRICRATATVFGVVAMCVAAAGAADAQRRAVPRPPAPPRHDVIVRGHVFVGGYFYDPMFGPYPWWSRTTYPYWYFPVYDRRADVRIQVTPKEAGVYVDGFYAGVVDDFDGVFQTLPLPPGRTSAERARMTCSLGCGCASLSSMRLVERSVP